MSLNLYSANVSDMCSRLPYALNSETAEAIIELRNSKPNFDVIDLERVTGYPAFKWTHLFINKVISFTSVQKQDQHLMSNKSHHDSVANESDDETCSIQPYWSEQLKEEENRVSRSARSSRHKTGEQIMEQLTTALPKANDYVCKQKPLKCEVNPPEELAHGFQGMNISSGKYELLEPPAREYESLYNSSVRMAKTPRAYDYDYTSQKGKEIHGNKPHYQRQEKKCRYSDAEADFNLHTQGPKYRYSKHDRQHKYSEGHRYKFEKDKHKHRIRRPSTSSSGSRSSSREKHGRGHKKRNKHHSSSSSSTSSSSRHRYSRHSSSESSSSSSPRRRHRHRKSERRSPYPPKLQVYTGEKSWADFIYQLERYAECYGWSSHKRAEKLVDYLGGKALEYVRELNIGQDFKLMKDKLSKRFGVKDAPITVRRSLPNLQQEELETLEEFGQRVNFLVMDGYPGAREKTIEQISVEYFLRGLLDKRAAAVAMDKNPKRLHKAIKYVKDAVNNGEAIYGKLQSQAGIKRVSLSNLETDLHSDLHTGYDIRSAQRQQMKNPSASHTSNFQKDMCQRMQHLEIMVKHLVRRSRTPPRYQPRPSETSPQRPNISTCCKCHQGGQLEHGCPTKISKPQSSTPNPSLN